MTHTSTEQAEARDLAYWIAHTTDNPTAALIQSLHARVQELEASQEHLKNALEDIASGEITRSHCVGPHCTEEVGVATADEMASRAAGALHWHGITQEKQGC